MSNSPLSQVVKHLNAADYLAAEQELWPLYKKSKKDFKIIKTLALTLLLQNKYNGALELYLEADGIQKNDFDVVNNISHLYLKKEEFQKSFDLAKKANELDPDKNNPYITFLEIFLRKRNFKEAVNQVQEIQKRIDFSSLVQNPNVIYSMLDSYVAIGDNEELLKLINYFKSKIFNPEIFYYQSSSLPEELDQASLEKAKEVLVYDGFKNPVERAKTISPILFGFAKYYEYHKDISKSDNFYVQGNKEIDKVQRFRPLANQKLITRIKNTFLNNKNSTKYPDSGGEGLIFILGMPRSGTTLVESIIASSPNTISGGELTSFHELVRSNFEDDPEAVKVDDPGAIYLNRIKFIREDHEKFIDKLPGNYHTVGFIKQIFPKAKIIYLKRNPWDNAISLYKQFYVSNIPYASTLFNIAVTYANHEEIMRFWKDECKVNYLTIEYENLVRDVDTSSKKIYEFCDISHVYNPEKRKNFFARTASKNQVNKDVHSTSIGKISFENEKSQFLEFLENQRSYWKKFRD